MANEVLKQADFESIADSMAKQYLEIMSKIGVAGSEADTYSKGAANTQADILAHTKADDNMWLAADLGDEVAAFALACKMSSFFTQAIADCLRAIERHTVKRNTTYDNINDYIDGVATRVHPYLRTIWSGIAASSTWPLSIDTTTGTHDEGNEVPKLGEYLVSGAGAGTYTVGTAIDTQVYGDGLIMAKVTSAGGIGAGSNIECTVTGKDMDGSTVQGIVTITAGASQGDEFDLASIRYASITGATITNGTNLDAWDFLIRDDRSPTL